MVYPPAVSRSLRSKVESVGGSASDWLYSAKHSRRLLSWEHKTGRSAECAALLNYAAGHHRLRIGRDRVDPRRHLPRGRAESDGIPVGLADCVCVYLGWRHGLHLHEPFLESHLGDPRSFAPHHFSDCATFRQSASRSFLAPYGAPSLSQPELRLLPTGLSKSAPPFPGSISLPSLVLRMEAIMAEEVFRIT